MDEEKDPQVRVMSRREKEDYQGVTIDENPDTEEERVERPRPHSRIYVHSSFGDTGLRRMGWGTKLLLVVGGAALLAFLFFVALPALLLLVGAAAAVWLIMRLISG
ncbi:peptidase M48 [Mitsuokella jalaludinii]|uniref:peptidase M48 n=1 Tax=Mitsuokella jalaludinii TaxID=187979 RepID=UPI003F9DA3A6